MAVSRILASSRYGLNCIATWGYTIRFDVSFMIREATMGVQPLDGEHATGLSDLLAIGFGTTVAMWTVGYVGHMPLIDIPPLVFVGLMLLCLVAGGWIVGRKTPRGVRGGLGLGLIVALLNLLVLGSTLAEPNTGQIVPQAWLWVPGYFTVCLALASAGAAAGKAARSDGPIRPIRPIGPSRDGLSASR